MTLNFRNISLLIALSAAGCEGGGRTSPIDADGDYSSAAVDCNDQDKAVHPAATERCNGLDDNCDGTVDEADAIDATVWWPDADSDGAGVAKDAFTACASTVSAAVPAGSPSDCDDANPAVHEGAVEVCNQIDDDCDGATDGEDAADAIVWWRDGDLDGFGRADDTVAACTNPFGYADATAGEDCDDEEPLSRPGGVELCNGVDDDCNGAVDEPEALDATAWAADADGDGFAPDDGFRSCADPGEGYADLTSIGIGDCDDANPARSLFTREVADDIDNDCDGRIDNDTERFDDDADGIAEVEGDCADWDPNVLPGRLEVPDNDIDDNCNSLVDEPAIAFDAADLLASPTTDQQPEGTPTPTTYVIVPDGYRDAALVFGQQDGFGRVVDTTQVRAQEVVPASGPYEAVPVEAYRLPDGTFEWVVAPGQPSDDASYVGVVKVAPSAVPNIPLREGNTLSRTLFLLDDDGNQLPVPLPSSDIGGTTEPEAYGGAPLVEVVSQQFFSIADEQRASIEVDGFDPSTDILVVGNQERVASTEDDWSYACTQSLTSGTLALECQGENGGGGGQTMTASVSQVRVHGPGRVRCIAPSGEEASCRDLPTIRITNDSVNRFFVPCPIGYQCMTVPSVLAQNNDSDDDFGWDVDIVDANPLDVGGMSLVDRVAGESGMPEGYVAGLRGQHVELAARGGSGGSYVDVRLYQVLVPESIAIRMHAFQVRSLDHNGMEDVEVSCFEDGDPTHAILIPTLTTYNPQYDPNQPSLASRLGNSLEKAAEAASDVFELSSKRDPKGILSELPGAVKAVIGFIDSLFGFEAPQQDDGDIAEITLGESGGCLTITTRLPNTSETPQIEHGVTVVSFYGQ